MTLWEPENIKVRVGSTGKGTIVRITMKRLSLPWLFPLSLFVDGERFPNVGTFAANPV